MEEAPEVTRGELLPPVLLLPLVLPQVELLPVESLLREVWLPAWCRIGVMHFAQAPTATNRKCRTE
jgi:hypothetical protein